MTVQSDGSRHGHNTALSRNLSVEMYIVSRAKSNGFRGVFETNFGLLAYYKSFFFIQSLRHIFQHRNQQLLSEEKTSLFEVVQSLEFARQQHGVNTVRRLRFVIIFGQSERKKPSVSQSKSRITDSTIFNTAPSRHVHVQGKIY